MIELKKGKFLIFLGLIIFVFILSFNSIKIITIQDKINIAAANIVSDVRVIPGGQPIGVKLYVDGVFVVGFSDIETKKRKRQSPAVINGIEIGDSILEANNEKLVSSRQLSNIVNSSKGDTLNFKIKRKNKILSINVKPIQGKYDNEYKIGLWVRDSTAGVGTMTFYDPRTKQFGALGHPINDVETGTLLPIKDGNIYNAKILSVEYGERGKPGELKGIFSEEDEIGKLSKNTTDGIYGKLKNNYNPESSYGKLMPVAKQNEIKEGPAKILTSIGGSVVKEYDIKIEKLTYQNKPNPKSMILKITDKELLSKTGGIVQGMSGSPIIQNGKLVGAITHVFVNKPEMGYGIYIEWMLKQIGIEL